MATAWAGWISKQERTRSAEPFRSRPLSMTFCIRLEPVSMPKKMPRQPALAMSAISSSSMQSVRALEPQVNSSLLSSRASQNSTTRLRSTVNISCTSSKELMPYVCLTLRISAIICAGLFSRKRRRKKSLVEQNVQAKGQPRPNSSGKWRQKRTSGKR